MMASFLQSLKTSMADSAGDDPQKRQMALIITGLSIVALILGMVSRAPVFDTFSPGTWLGFILYLLSLGTVNNSGKNIMAKIAFWASFIAMSVSIFLSVTA